MPYNLRLITGKEAILASKLKAERYTLRLPKMIYRVLLKEESLVQLDEQSAFYGDGSRSDRIYKDYPMYLEAIYSPEQMGLDGFGIDTSRQIMFFGATYLFNEAGITPAEGDLIVWDGDSYEVRTIKPKEDSQISKTNFFTEIQMVADIPFADMPQHREET